MSAPPPDSLCAPLFELVTLKSGIKSLRLIENKEIFHPGIGPVAEAMHLHVEQHRFSERVRGTSPFVLWDVGLGAGANALTAIEAVKDYDCKVEIHSFDQTDEPLRFALAHAADLAYPLPYRDLIHQLLSLGKAQVTPQMTWTFHRGNFATQMQRLDIPAPHSIFYDPYSPSNNVEMWTFAHFKKLKDRLDPSRPCLLTNYTRSTAMRVTWLLAGFFVGVGTVIGQKAETTLVSSHLEDLDAPLGVEWLRRVKASRNSAPLHGPAYTLNPINEADFQKLLDHPQFAGRAPQGETHDAH